MKNLIAILSFAVLLSSCNKTENTKVSSTKSDSIETKKEFAIDSLRVQDSVKVAKTLTLSFEKQILLFPDITNKTLLDSIYKPANISSEDYSKKTLSGILEKFKTESLKKDDSQEYMPEFKQTWEEMSAMKLISNQDDILTLQYAGNGYSGGAHGYYFESYKAFDLKNNKVISQNDIFKNPTDVSWNKILQNHFDEPEQKEMLLVDKIELNNNFFFDQNKITFVYNQYEITAYAAGVVYITLNFKDIKDQLKPEFIQQYKIK
ncbi:RsiV family protein [Epilithonimonas sp. JDS]|uniref:RsiV family protein n=1 Tax=Epilithonimonas sp. JDS TaxID=2902797 RepID=UPI001E5A8369|nr:RsiV family protein [Epilithonimonas sp. JDS]MCD9854770.1 RsiV family protein [Epilithonimonas sp. JDS]